MLSTVKVGALKLVDKRQRRTDTQVSRFFLRNTKLFNQK
jgi:hypothetical protein